MHIKAEEAIRKENRKEEEPGKESSQCKAANRRNGTTLFGAAPIRKISPRSEMGKRVHPPFPFPALRPYLAGGATGLGESKGFVPKGAISTPRTQLSISVFKAVFSSSGYFLQ